MIDSLHNALLLYENAAAHQSELREALAAAMDRLLRAAEDVREIQGCLGKADFELGRTRYMIRKSGYGEILGRKHGHAKLNGTFQLS